MVFVSGYRNIIGNSHYGVVALLNELRVPVRLGFRADIAAELDLIGILRPLQLEGVAVFKPVIRSLLLIAVTDLLPEHSVMIPDTAAVCGIAQG